jgi:hypothetical protein
MTPPEPKQLRIAIISTARSGNTWLMHLLSRLYEIPHFFINSPTDIRWDSLPKSCVLVTHGNRQPWLVTQLGRHGFQVVTLARHPLDVLISNLHVAFSVVTTRGPDATASWSIAGAMPRSTIFLDYATGAEASSLLAVSREWWRAPGIRQLRYEALVTDAGGELERLVESLGSDVRRPISDVVAELSIPALRALTGNDLHFWQGKPGLWRALLPTAEASAIAEAQQDVFLELGYACDPDPALDGRQADANWLDLVRAERIEEIRKLRDFRQELANSHLVRVGEVGPVGLELARALRRLSRRYPGLSAGVKRLVHLRD